MPTPSGTVRNPHLGWIRLNVQDTTGDGYPDKLTAVDWAYESNPFTPIRAGDVGAAPEPSSLTLASLALGAAGVMALRRRQAAKAPA